MNIKVGDLITAYHSGIHRVLEIERRFYKTEQDIPSIYKDTVKVGDEYSSLVHYEKVLQENGVFPKKKVQNRCDIGFCKPASDYIRGREIELNKLKNNFFTL